MEQDTSYCLYISYNQRKVLLSCSIINNVWRLLQTLFMKIGSNFWRILVLSLEVKYLFASTIYDNQCRDISFYINL